MPRAGVELSGSGAVTGRNEPMEKVPMLAEGYEKLTADLKALRAERPLIVDAIEEARAHGDLQSDQS